MKKNFFLGENKRLFYEVERSVRGQVLVLAWAIVICVGTLIVGCGGTENNAEFAATTRAEAEARAKRDAVCMVMSQVDVYVKSTGRSMERINERMKNRDSSTFNGFVGAVGDVRQRLKMVRQLCENLSTIDVSNCPPDFQAVFFVYLRKLDELAQMTDKLSGSNGFKGFVSGVWDVSSSGEAVGEEMVAAASELRQVAAQYGYVSKE